MRIPPRDRGQENILRRGYRADSGNVPSRRGGDRRRPSSHRRQVHHGPEGRGARRFNDQAEEGHPHALQHHARHRAGPGTLQGNDGTGHGNGVHHPGRWGITQPVGAGERFPNILPALALRLQIPKKTHSQSRIFSPVLGVSFQEPLKESPTN